MGSLGKSVYRIVVAGKAGEKKVCKEIKKMEESKMQYVCDVCGWIYDEESGDSDLGIAPGTKFEDLPEDFLCPLCSVGKELFSVIE